MIGAERRRRRRLRLCSATEMGEHGRLGLEERGSSEDLQLDYLLPWPVWPVDSQGMPAGVGD